MESTATGLKDSTKDRGRHRLLTARPSTTRAKSGSARPHHHHHHHQHPTPHSPCSPLFADSFTSSHSPPTARSTSTTSGRPRSPSAATTATDSTSNSQYALSSSVSHSAGLHFNTMSEQGCPRTDPDGTREGADEDEDDDPSHALSPNQTRRRESTKATPASSSSRFFRSIVHKFGRTFNRNYFLPHDKLEQERNNLQHEISVEAHDGELFLCPVVNPRRVLDIGTGTGIWAVEFARRHPDSDVLGIDLDPTPQPPYIVPNCHFQIADVYEDWKYGHMFDFIHIRSLGEPVNKSRLFKLIHDNLEPGGWVEFQEWVLHVQSSDRSLDGTALQKWNQNLMEGTKNLGKNVFYALDYKPQLEQLGFRNIVELKYAIPMNAWAPGKQSQKIGTLQRTNVLQVVDIYSLAIFTQGLGWSKDAVEKMLAETRKDVDNTKIHSYTTLMTVYGQKPLLSSASSFDKPYQTTRTTTWQQRPSVS